MCLRDSRANLIPFVSGVNISRDGLIVTCKHVIEDVQTDVWLDVERLKPGDRWMEELERALAESYSRPVREPPAGRETGRSHNESTPFFRFTNIEAWENSEPAFGWANAVQGFPKRRVWKCSFELHGI